MLTETEFETLLGSEVEGLLRKVALQFLETGEMKVVVAA